MTAMHATLPLLDALSFPSIRRSDLQALQVNLTYRCNQRCLHCHVNAGPTRKEAMSDESLALLREVIDAHSVQTLDLTGGAPEMHPRFRELVMHARSDIAQPNHHGAIDAVAFFSARRRT